MELFIFRALERLVAVVIGGLAIYLGYRLFSAVKATGEGDAEVKLPGDVTVMISRVGPGVFFALFGALVVAASLAFPVTYSETGGATNDGPVVRSRSISGIGESGQHNGIQEPEQGQKPARAVTTQESLELERLRVRQLVTFLNQLPKLLDPGLTALQRQRIDQEARATKLRLMEGVWDEDWGQFEEFRLWAEDGAEADESEAFRTAAEFYTFGEDRSL